MRLRRKFLTLSRLSMVAVAWCVGFNLTAGERIRFSKPAVELASPGSELANLPEPKDRTMEFGSGTPPSGMDAALQMRPQVIPIPNRRREEEDLSPLALSDPNRKFERAMKDMDRLNGRDPMDLRDPNKLRDPSQRGSENGAAPTPWSLDPSNPQRKDEARSRSSITEFGRDARAPGGRSTESGRSGRNSTDREKQHERSPFDAAENLGGDAYRSSSVFDIFSPRPKEKPTAFQLERRADFEKLLNPGAGQVVKGPGSLEPVGSTTPQQPVGLRPPILRGGLQPNQPPADPTTAFNRQQERWNGPVFDNAYKKYMPPAAATPSPAATPFQTPLNRQPTMHEFPTRRL